MTGQVNQTDTQGRPHGIWKKTATHSAHYGEDVTTSMEKFKGSLRTTLEQAHSVKNLIFSTSNESFNKSL
jgi:hypothetical protein